MQVQRGILKALLVTEGNTIVHATTEVDQLGVLANLQSLLNVGEDMST